ncbi:hypothetical protein K443DRAFT_671173 [Laccaria amethystina LaAM-08-1]|uniref:P-type ATPase C-terminal domain-containing protein n=1 Tax=Laccaria amethystina LaAM-08-1 TaxID=1095629 RepID=A0A0C9XXZ1_9AGAR|nr:hypothetical protein K443DRAFT_671173 [Laccaria amethystina LaAM-08-1]
MCFLPLYAVVAPAIGFSTEYSGIVHRLWTSSVFYFVLVFIPIFCLVRDFVWKSYWHRTYTPPSYHIAQELQKTNVPDYRPRQEQYVPKIPFLSHLASFNRQSRKSVQRSACGGIVDLLSARRRVQENRTRPRSFERTIHRNRMHDHLVIRLETKTVY